MSIPEPFASTVNITSSILTNIASDIVEHHAKALEGTLVGKLLKWGGIIEPNFLDHLRETIKVSLQLFFQNYPQYDLFGIETFFHDPLVAKQIGDYILSRTPINSDQIQKSLHKHL